MISKLYSDCCIFEKISQVKQDYLSTDKLKAINLWSNTLFAGIKGTSTLLSNPQIAKIIFDGIAEQRKSLRSVDQSKLKDVDALLTALELSEQKLKELQIDPLQVLKQKGMQNLNPQIIDVLKSNLKTLSDGLDFSKYRHYTLNTAGLAPYVDLDYQQQKPVSSRDMGY